MNSTILSAPANIQVSSVLPLKMDSIPKELQLPLVVLIGLIGFLLVIGISRISAKKDENKAVASESKTPSTPRTPRTPKKKGTPIESKTGSVMTPGGRRSARLAKVRKED